MKKAILGRIVASNAGRTVLAGMAAAALAACETTTRDGAGDESRGEMSERDAAKTAAFFEKYEKTGERERCLFTQQIRQITPITDRAFLVRYGVKDFYINELSGRCRGAGAPGTALAYTTTGAQLCALELVQVIDFNGSVPRGACGLSDFQELRKKSDDAEEDAAPADNETAG
ncbi:MAG: DUF6491 family protein [Pseudomonadota bacterium]